MPTTIILDNFTDTGHTPLPSHTISPTNTVSAAWATPAGAGTDGFWITLSGDAAEQNTASTYGWATLDSGHADGDISVTVQRSGDCELYLLFRFTDTNNWWALMWRGLTGDVHLFKVSGGSATEPFGSTNKTFSTGTPYLLKVVLSGSSITATIDGGSTLSGSDSFQASATQHGMIGGFIASLSQFDDFTMTIPSGGGNPWSAYAQQ